MGTATAKRAVGVMLAGLLLMLSACASNSFKAEVSRFHQLPPPGGEVTVIVPAEGVLDSLEFNTYARPIAARLDFLGYREAAGVEPEIIATLGYAAMPDPGYRPPSGPTIGIGVGSFGRHVGGGVSTTVDLSDTKAVYYRYFLSLVLTDAKTGERLYEGSVTGYAKGPNLPGVMPLLTEALFQDWPGPSGTTTIVKIDPQ